jgi:hypothetical protein
MFLRNVGVSPDYAVLYVIQQVYVCFAANARAQLVNGLQALQKCRPFNNLFKAAFPNWRHATHWWHLKVGCVRRQVGSEVLRAVIVNITTVCYVTPCSPSRRFLDVSKGRNVSNFRVEE